MIRFILFILFTLFLYTNSYAFELAELKSETADDLLLFFEEEEILTLATKQLQSVKEAPAIATVITAEQIRVMGARDIVDVLRRIPGIGMTKGHYGKEEIEVRGIKTINSEKVKFLLNGLSVNMLFDGGYAFLFDGLSLDNVKRIEVIRGPGSALHGANAFSAVINVVTKDGEDMDGIIATVGRGSFDTNKINLQAGKRFKTLDVAFALDYLTTDGAKLRVDKDVLGNSGHTIEYEDKLETELKLSYNDFSLRSKYIKRVNARYLGVGFALNDDTEVDARLYLAELLYNHKFGPEINVLAKTYFLRIRGNGFWEAVPENAIPGFPDGQKVLSNINNRTYGAEIQADYELFAGNLITLGLVSEKREQYDLEQKTNFDPETGAAWGEMRDIPLNREVTRKIQAIYLQDIWDMTKDISLTLGVRHDNYSDFGDTTNPRIAVVWNFLSNWDTKFLYGTAFRAPSFVELYNQNNTIELGNPDLKPEMIETFEVSLGYSAVDHTSVRGTYFHNDFEDKIQSVVDPSIPGFSRFKNTGGAEVNGIEAEIKTKLKKNLRAYTNYTYQYPVDKETDSRLPDVPSHKGNIGFNAFLYKHLNINANLFLSDERPRAEGDGRGPLPGYGLVDLTVILENIYHGFELRGSVYNLFDKDYSDPAPANTVENDLPREGRSYFAELRYIF